MRRTLVTDVMTRDAVTVGPATTYAEILKTLRGKGISGVPVVGPDGRVMGVVSESDLLRKEEFKSPLEDAPLNFESPAHQERRRRAEADTAYDLMSTPAITLGPASTVIEAARLMAMHHVTRLPVVDHRGLLMGIVSRGDLLKAFNRPDEEIRDEVTRDVVHRYLWQDATLVQVDVKDGVVTLRGRLDVRSLIPIAERLTSVVEGVVRVVNELEYETDDTMASPGQTR
jgi:CBS-domain-containing membrane protein